MTCRCSHGREDHFRQTLVSDPERADVLLVKTSGCYRCPCEEFECAPEKPEGDR